MKCFVSSQSSWKEETPLSFFYFSFSNIIIFLSPSLDVLVLIFIYIYIYIYKERLFRIFFFKCEFLSVIIYHFVSFFISLSLFDFNFCINSRKENKRRDRSYLVIREQKNNIILHYYNTTFLFFLKKKW